VKQELVDLLYARYPNLYKDHLRWSFECGSGWFQLIDELSAKVEAWILTLPEDIRAQTKASQCKEKFAGLRWHLDVVDWDAYQSSGIGIEIAKAEDTSYTICEECGQPGKRRPGGWMKTMCDEHNQERLLRIQMFDAERSVRKK